MSKTFIERVREATKSVYINRIRERILTVAESGNYQTKIVLDNDWWNNINVEKTIDYLRKDGFEVNVTKARSRKSLTSEQLYTTINISW
jgi:hypothetical protein